jgi:hypothetical protein
MDWLNMPIARLCPENLLNAMAVNPGIHRQAGLALVPFVPSGGVLTGTLHWAILQRGRNYSRITPILP